jgi:S-DNA-T family DNA segregation ATPase FtsK/SpoIIIE
MFGYEGNVFMRSVIGRAGTGILLLFILVSITTAAYNIPLKWFHFEEWREKQKERRTMRRAARKERHEQKKRDRENRKKLKNQPLSPNDSDSPEGNNYAPQTAQPPHVQNTEPSEDNHQTREPETTPQEPSAPPAPGQLINEKDQVRFTIEKPLQPEEDISPTPPSAMRQGSLGTDYDPTLDLPHFRFPEYDLLKTYDDATPIAIQNQELKENKQQIVDTLNHYAIKITSIKATPGPAVTLYEIVPAPGIRIAKIKNLADDIALSLAAHGIRIIAPIPGKGTIGIEVPNKNPQTVSMKTLLKSSKFVQSKYELPIALGKTISNDSFIADLAKMPHLLVAGATGQGKSVGLNGIIASLLYSKHPAVCKFILIDPKKVELSLYSKIERHYLAKLPDAKEAIITETREVVRTLNSLVLEMEDRYNLLKNAHVKSLKEYNTKFIARKLNPENGHRFMPYLILIIDEFADLIMTAGKEIEGPITRLAQLARAVGIHLIIATQRPSVNVITGSIKANFPARIAYRVISKFDSRTILDSGGADQLVGRGDMLLSTGRELVRLQGAFIDTPEIERITEFIGAQKAYSNAFQLPEYLDEESETRKDLEDLGRDTMFEEAARVVVENQHGSTSLLQRKLKIGYNRAGRIIDQLEAAGIVGPFEGSKAREVMIRDIIGLEQLLKELDNINK